ncbi:MAG: hypothetical protein ACYSRQ_04325 [Planctomycetota bacterium]|jgi:hypothetical protein
MKRTKRKIDESTKLKESYKISLRQDIIINNIIIIITEDFKLP